MAALAAVAIERGDPADASILGCALHAARRQGFLNTVIMTSPKVSAHLVEDAAELLPDPFIEQLIIAALEVRSAQDGAGQPGRVLIEPSLLPNSASSRSQALRRAADLRLL